MVLDCFSCLEDEELNKEERILGSLCIFYEDIHSVEDLNLFGDDLSKAAEQMFLFFNCGDDSMDKHIVKLQNRESQRATERVYELFVEDPDNKILSIVFIANIKSITLPEAQYSTINQRYLLSEKNKSHDI